MKRILIEDDEGKLVSVNLLLEFVRKVERRYGKGVVERIFNELKAEKENIEEKE